MITLPTTEARTKLDNLMDEMALSHQPIQIRGKRTNAVLITGKDWRAIEETLYLLSIPGIRESIREGLETPINKCSKELKW